MPLSRPRSSRGRAERQVASPDGRLSFLLKRTPRGVHVDRLNQMDMRRTEYVAVFPDRQQFDRFLDVDELRFQYAVVYAEVRRAFDSLIELDA
jgi:hypothetical protein